MWFRELEGTTTAENLAAAADGENLSGPTCTMSSPRRLKKRASSSLLKSSVRLAQSRSIMRSYRALLHNVETAAVFEKSEVRYGNAVIAATSS